MFLCAAFIAAPIGMAAIGSASAVSAEPRCYKNSSGTCVEDPTTAPAPPPNATALCPSRETFLICPDGHTGVATSVTSCEFALNVHESYLSQGGPTVIAYSPVTGDTYEMECHAGFTSRLSNGMTVDSVRCVGGNNAVVILW